LKYTGIFYFVFSLFKHIWKKWFRVSKVYINRLCF